MMGFSLSPSPSILFDGIKGRKERKKKRLMLLLIRPWKSVASGPRFFLLLLRILPWGEPGFAYIYFQISRLPLPPSNRPRNPDQIPPLFFPKAEASLPLPHPGDKRYQAHTNPFKNLPPTHSGYGWKKNVLPPSPPLP